MPYWDYEARASKYGQPCVGSKVKNLDRSARQGGVRAGNPKVGINLAGEAAEGAGLALRRSQRRRRPGQAPVAAAANSGSRGNERSTETRQNIATGSQALLDG